MAAGDIGIDAYFADDPGSVAYHGPDERVDPVPFVESGRWQDNAALRASYNLLIAGLDPDQLEEWQQPFDTVGAVAANAGSGKSHLIVARLLRGCFDTQLARATVAISFTNKSGRELKTRFNKLFEAHLNPFERRALPRPTIGTLHGYGYTVMANVWGLTRSVLTPSRTRRLLRDLPTVLDAEVGAAGVKRIATAFEEAAAQCESHYLAWPEFDADGGFVRCHDMMARHPVWAGPDPRAGLAEPLALLDWFAAVNARARLYQYAAPADWATRQREVVSRYASMAQVSGATLAGMMVDYMTAKYAANALDLGDLLVQPVFLMAQHARLRRQVRTRFSQFLIDEAQDLGFGDHALVGLSFGAPDLLDDAEAMADRSLIIVGDTKQTLYRWRWAMPDILERLDRYLGIPVRFGKLNRNYRSVEVLVVLANAFAEGFTRLHLSPSVAVVPAAPDAVEVLYFHDTDQEDSWIATEMRRLHHQGNPWGAMTFLARTNRDLQQFEAVLLARNIPYKMRSDPKGITQSPAYTFVHAMFSLALNPRDATALAAFGSIIKGVGEKTMERVRRLVLDGLRDDPTASVVSILRQTEDKGAATVLALLHVVLPVITAGLAEMELPDLLNRLRGVMLIRCAFADVQHSGAMIRLTMEWPPVERIFRLIASVYGVYASDTDFDMLSVERRTRDVHASLALSKDAAESEGEAEDGRRVILSTTHGYKALQNHFIFGGHLTRMMAIPAAEMDDEMCCFYVIVTRPQRKLYLTASYTVRDFANVPRPGIPNPFLQRYHTGLRKLLAAAA